MRTSALCKAGVLIGRDTTHGTRNDGHNYVNLGFKITLEQEFWQGIMSTQKDELCVMHIYCLHSNLINKKSFSGPFWVQKENLGDFIWEIH